MAAPVLQSRSAAPPLPPGPRYLSPLSFLRELRPDTLGYLERVQRDHGDVSCIRIGLLRSCLLAHPDAARRVLVENHRNYWKGRLVGKLKRLSGEGLLFSEGDTWRHQRRLVAPAFQRGHVLRLVPAMAGVLEEVLARWARELADGDVFDLVPEASRLALDVVCRALFGAEVPGGGAAFHERVNEAIAYANYLVNSFTPAPLFVPTPRNRRALRTRRAIDAVIFEMIRLARERPRDGLLRRLVEARDEETGGPMSEVELRDQMLTLLVAGHETTAVALCWTFHLLGQHPEVAAALRREADSVLGKGVPAGAGEVGRLALARRVVQEGMRLYPPVWVVSRQAYADDEIAGFRIPRKATVTISPWLIHRHPGIWDDPERFDPDRFLPERVARRPRLAWLPFITGPRRCVGEEFALLEATLALAMIVRRFDVRPLAGRAVVPDPILTLRPRGGLPVRLLARDTSSGQGQTPDGPGGPSKQA